MYGQNTDDTYMQSAQVLENPATVNDQRNREVFKTQKVCGIVVCEECLKPRCIYSDKKLTREQVSLRDLLIPGIVRLMYWNTCNSQRYMCMQI